MRALTRTRCALAVLELLRFKSREKSAALFPQRDHPPLVDWLEIVKERYASDSVSDRDAGPPRLGFDRGREKP